MYITLNTFNVANTILMNITLRNTAMQGYFIRDSAILSDVNGCNAKLEIVDGPAEIYCMLDECDYSSEDEESVSWVEPGSTLSSQVELNYMCDFTDAPAGIYSIRFSTEILPCIDLEFSECDSPIGLVSEGLFTINNWG